MQFVDSQRSGRRTAALLLCAGIFAAQPAPSIAQAQDAATSAAPAASAAVRRSSPYRPATMPASARNVYAVTTGVTDLKVRRTNTGHLIRFSYKVTNAEQAKALADRQAKPVLIGHASRAVLSVPVMDKVGPLRQSTAPEVGKEYWMVFSNKGDLVKSGERVSVVIGKFRAEGLVVE